MLESSLVFLLPGAIAGFVTATASGRAIIFFAGATTVLALVHNVTIVRVALVIGGTAWLLALATLSASMQLSLPAWVRARGLSVYQLVFMGGQAIGSLVWGLLAGATSSVTALLVSAALLLVCALSAWWWPRPWCGAGASAGATRKATCGTSPGRPAPRWTPAAR